MRSATKLVESKARERRVNDLIGILPESWSVSKLKFIAKITNGDSLAAELKEKFSADVENYRPYIASKDINVSTSKIDYQNGIKIPLENKKYKVAPRDSALLCIEGGSAGRKIAYTENDVCYVNKLACIHSNNVSNRFIYYSLFAEAFQTQFKHSLSGLIGGVAISAINNFSIVVPPNEAQAQIVKYLDDKVIQIDEAINTKQLQVSLLAERKKKIIRNAVIQGLNPNCTMKDSGIEWIGMVPRHWEVVRFKNLFSQSRLPVRPNDGVVTSYRDGQVTLRSNRRLDGYTEAIIEGGYQGVRVGQLVLNSMDAFEGAIGVSESEGKCTPEYVICDPKTEVVSQFYFSYLLREMALAKYIQVVCNAVRQRAVRIRFNNLSGLYMVLPPRSEQDAIVEFIQHESKQINAGIDHLNKQIEKLKEYKTILINSAVTGKIKVA